MSDSQILPEDADIRKNIPLATGVLDYFPLALASIARLSKAGNDQHNPGEPLHWARGKSADHADSALRHLVDRGKFDKDGQRHTAKAAWRILAELQEEIEREQWAIAQDLGASPAPYPTLIPSLIRDIERLRAWTWGSATYMLEEAVTKLLVYAQKPEAYYAVPLTPERETLKAYKKLAAAFSWKVTPEGSDYWAEISNILEDLEDE